MSDDTTPKDKPKLKLVRPPQEKAIVEPVEGSSFETPADEWVQTQISMTALAKKWKLARATLYRRRKRENWDRRKVEFNKLVEEKRQKLAEERRHADTEDPKIGGTVPPITIDEAVETQRTARVDEAAADKRAQAEVVMHRVAYATASHVARLMTPEKIQNLNAPADWLELVKIIRHGTMIYDKILGPPEPPPKPHTVFEVRIEEKGGAISTIERGTDETLEQALERVEVEYKAAKARILESYGGPASPPRPPAPEGVPTIDGEPLN